MSAPLFSELTAEDRRNRLVDIADLPLAAPLSPAVLAALQSARARPAVDEIVGLAGLYRSPSLPQAVGGVDVCEAGEDRLERIPVGVRPALVSLFLGRFAGQAVQHRVDGTHDIVHDFGLVRPVLGQHGQDGKGDHFVGQQAPVHLFKVIGAVAHRIPRWLVARIKAVFVRGVE